jgi:hypothetical protein
LHGSFIGITKQFLEKEFKSLEKAPFLFSEEIFLAECCNRSHLKLKYVDKVKLLHNEHATTGIYISKNTRGLLVRSINQIITLFYA